MPGILLHTQSRAISDVVGGRIGSGWGEGAANQEMGPEVEGGDFLALKIKGDGIHRMIKPTGFKKHHFDLTFSLYEYPSFDPLLASAQFPPWINGTKSHRDLRFPPSLRQPQK